MVRSLLAVVVTTAMLYGGTVSMASAQDQALPCQVNMRGRFLYVFDGTLSMCLKTTQAEGVRPGFRYGMWGNVYLAVDHRGQIYFFDPEAGWTFLTTLVNDDNSTGSLSDRCRAGDLEACATLSQNLDQALDGYNRLYPPGWFRE